MIYEADIHVASDALLALESPERGAFERLAQLFGFARDLDDDRRRRLASVVGSVLDGLARCGLDDAVFASCDDRPCFVDRRGDEADLATLRTELTAGDAAFERLRLVAREPHPDEGSHDPYRSTTGERTTLSLCATVELHRPAPLDGYPLRVRIHGLIRSLRATADADRLALRDRVRAFVERMAGAPVHGHDDLPREFQDRVSGIAAGLGRAFDSAHIDVAMRTAIVLPREPDMAGLPDLPKDAGPFARLPGSESALRYAFVWPQVHAPLRYRHMLLLDDRGRRVLATGATPLAGEAFAVGRAPVDLPAPDILTFSGHGWEPEARRHYMLASDTDCEGIEGAIALLTHERRKFDCGSRGPARPNTISTNSAGSFRIEADPLF